MNNAGIFVIFIDSPVKLSTKIFDWRKKSQINPPGGPDEEVVFLD
jgi:hypothetical protein